MGDKGLLELVGLIKADSRKWKMLEVSLKMLPSYCK